jgi:hypothetical protein
VTGESAFGSRVDTTVEAGASLATGEFALGSEACATATVMVGNSLKTGESDLGSTAS